MAKATLFVLIAVASGLLVYLLATPRTVRVDAASHSTRTQPQGVTHSQPPVSNGGHSNPEIPSSSIQPGSSANSVDSTPAIDPPLTNEQRTQKDLEVRRGPLYAWIRDNMQDILVGWQPSSADPATLDLYMSQADSNASDVSLCMNKLVAPYAARYGFNHVRFFVPNPPTESDHWRLDSESTPDDSGSWHLYRK